MPAGGLRRGVGAEPDAPPSGGGEGAGGGGGQGGPRFTSQTALLPGAGGGGGGAGLNGGAAVSLAKPPSYEELLAGVGAVARRRLEARPTVLIAGGLSLDPATHEARRGDTEIELSAREVSILAAFMRRPGRV